jgi:Large eukaryotic DNA virus major capsid protein/Major capsid protein N-terminus
MGGGYYDLKHIGAQDIYLTAVPNKSYFVDNFNIKNRYGRFTTEDVELAIEDPKFGSMHSVQILRNGDLAIDLTVVIKLPEGVDWLDDIEDAIVKKVELKIGGFIVDSLTNDFIHILNGLKKKTSIHKGNLIYVHLPFWFCRNPSHALYLVSLYNYDVRLDVEFESFEKLVKRDYQFEEVPKIKTAGVLGEFVYLEQEQKKNFLNDNHEFLIEQHQSGSEEIDFLIKKPFTKTNLDFNHPVKEIIWVFSDENANTSKYFNYISLAESICITLDNNDRLMKQPKEYFQVYQQNKHHTNLMDDVYTYSFALNPEKLTPSGTSNFSRFNKVELWQNLDKNIQNSKYKIKFFSISYNVFRIKDGCGGITYAN